MKETQKRAVQAAIDQIPELRGAGVVLFEEEGCEVLRKSNHVSGLETYVILEQDPAGDGAGASSALATDPTSTRSRLTPELVSMGLNCGAAVLTGLALTAEGAAAPLTAGGTAVLIIPTVAAASATSLQCGISIGRVINHFIDPRLDAMLDSQQWYQNASNVLDVISLFDAGGAAADSIKAIIRLRRATHKPMMELLQGLNRAERKQLAKDLATHTIRPSSNKQLKAAIRAGKVPKIYSNQAVTMALKQRLYALLSSATSVAESSRTGLIHKFQVHIFQE